MKWSDKQVPLPTHKNTPTKYLLKQIKDWSNYIEVSEPL